MTLYRYTFLLCVVFSYSSASDAGPPHSILDILPNTSIIYKHNSNHNISCIGYNLKHNAPILLYQIKNGKSYRRASATSNVLKVVLNLTESDNGTSLQCYTMYKYYSKYKNTINLLLNSTPDVQSVQDEMNAVSTVPSQVTIPNAESYWKTVGLITAVVIIIILLMIIILLVMRKQSESKNVSSSDNRTSFKTGDGIKELQSRLDQWTNNEYQNENEYVVSDYYSYADNEIHGIYINLENEYYESCNKQ